MASESTDHSALGLMGYWLRAHLGSRNIVSYHNIFVFRVWLLDEELTNYSAVLMIVQLKSGI